MDTSTGGARRRERTGKKAGREAASDFDLAEVGGLPVKARRRDAREPDWLHIATPDPAFFLRDA